MSEIYDPMIMQMHQRAAEVISQDEARVRRGMVRYILPLTVVKLAAVGVYLHLESKIPDETPATYSCNDFSPDVLDPPTDDTFGLRAGLKLDGRQITKDNMEPMVDPWGEPLKKRDGTTIGVKTLGT